MYAMAPPAGAPPLLAPLVFGKEYVTRQETTLIMKEKVFSWSGDAFKIKDPSGMVWFGVGGKALSCRDRKTLVDCSGKVLAKLHSKIMTVKRRQIIQSAGGAEIATVAQKSAIQLKDNCTVNLTGVNPPEEWTVEGDIIGRKFTVHARGVAIATVKHDTFGLVNKLTDKDTYVLTIAPGVDAALVVAIVVSVDEICHHDQADCV